MNRLRMKVYRMNHANGSPRKYWCYINSPSGLTTRWGAAGNSLQENVKNITNRALTNLVNEKLSKGYVYEGEYEVSDQINFDTANAPSQPQEVPKKFSDVVMFWDTGTLPDGWETVAQKAFGSASQIIITSNPLTQTIVVDGNESYPIVLKPGASGIIKVGTGVDYKLGLVLLRLAKSLPITITDNNSEVIADKHAMKSLFNHSPFKQGELLDEYDEFAQTVGVSPKADMDFIKANPVFSQFF